MTHYKSNLRDLQFNLFEVFEADRAFGQAPYEEIDAETARERCEEVRQFIRSYPWQPITGSMPVTTSIGVTTSPDGSGPLAALLAQADRHLYAAKHAGRDRVR